MPNNVSVTLAERGIVFNAPMVRAILAGKKTQTRRILSPQPQSGAAGDLRSDTGSGRRLAAWALKAVYEGPPHPDWVRDCPFGQPGHKLWVREKFVRETENKMLFRADKPVGQDEGPWRNALHLRRSDTRLVLEITSVRVERLHEITVADAIACGADWRDGTEPARRGESVGCRIDMRQAYRVLWESTHGPFSWSTNPWIWVLGFKLCASAPK